MLFQATKRFFSCMFYYTTTRLALLQNQDCEQKHFQGHGCLESCQNRIRWKNKGLLVNP